MDLDGGNKRVYNRLGGPTGDSKNQKVCFHWQAGKCNRHPCAFLHSEVPSSNGTSSKRPHGSVDNSSFSGSGRRGPSFNTWGPGRGGGRGGRGGGVGGGGGRGVVVKADRVCNYWVQGNCGYGERCKFLHSWSLGDGFTLLTQLEGHTKVNEKALVYRIIMLLYSRFYLIIVKLIYCKLQHVYIEFYDTQSHPYLCVGVFVIFDYVLNGKYVAMKGKC